MTRRRLLIVVNDPGFFLSHRLPVAVAAREAGYDVEIATGPGPAVREIGALGFVHHQFHLSRRGTNPLVELRTLWSLYRLFRRRRPDIVHLVTIKPVLFGGLAARLADVPAVVVAITGLGPGLAGRSLRGKAMRGTIEILYRLSLRHPNLRAIFQNPDDLAFVTGIGAVEGDGAVLLRGSGVDLAAYQAIPERPGAPAVIMASRLLRDKGVPEFAEAARIVRTRHPEAAFKLAGGPDPGSPSSLSQSEVDQLVKGGDVELLGYRRDIPRLFEDAHIIVHPSTYLEGLPKVLAEAAACGRAVITTDVSGCRDAIEPGVTGLLVPPHDAQALAAAIELLIEDPDRRREMGRAGRRLAERDFDVRGIVSAHLGLYDLLLGRAYPHRTTARP